MSGNIKIIKFTVVLSCIFALLTYIVSLNMELLFFAPNWTWMSNNFALTVSGGIFASTLVVMLCEIQKYLSNKANCELYLFYQTLYLYTALLQAQKGIEEYVKNPAKPIPENLLSQSVYRTQCQINAVQNTDYTTFSSKNRLVSARQKFFLESLADMNSFLLSDNYLKQAIITTKIRNLEQNHSQKFITSSDLLVQETLSIINKKSLSLLECVSNFLQEIDINCNSRFHWDELKQSIHRVYANVSDAGSFEGFLKQGE